LLRFQNEDAMKKQSLKDRMDEHLGAKHPGKKKESMKARRDEMEGMEHKMKKAKAKMKKKK
jgi:hypothetical protein